MIDFLGEIEKVDRMGSGPRRATKSRLLVTMANENQDDLFEYIFANGRFSNDDYMRLIWMGMYTAYSEPDRNENWVSFIARIIARIDELPDRIQAHLEWMRETHNWRA